MWMTLRCGLLLVATYLVHTILAQNFDALVNSVFNAHNTARTNPEAYKDLIQTELDEKVYFDTGLNKWIKCLDAAFNKSAGHTSCSSKLTVSSNGTSYWDSAIADLTNDTGQHYYPVNALEWSYGLAASCTDHVLDIGPCAATGHNGTDNSTAFE